jgi:hypothetical protein
MTVVGKATRDMKILSEINERSRAAWGTTFLPGNSWLETMTFPTDPLRAARGFSYLGMDDVQSRACKQLGGQSLSNVVQMQGPRMVIYLDGERQPGGLETIRELVPVKDILAIEAYSDWMSIPGIWRTPDACAVIAFWTRRR